MMEWLRLNRHNLNKPSRKSIRGAEVIVFMSPYDIPEAVRAGVDAATGRLVIQFKYSAGSEDPDEPLDTESKAGPVRLMVGRHSHRLYRVELDAVRLNVDQVEVHVLQKVDEAIDRLSENRRRPPNRGHYGVARKVIAERGGDLLKELGGCNPR